MSNSEQSNAESNRFDKSEYQKEYMRKKRAAEKLKKELVEDQSGGVNLASVEKEAVVEAGVLRIEMGSQENPEIVKLAMSPAMELTATDREFEEMAPNYFIYGKEIKDRKCWQCGKVFTTRLELNKFCGPKCKEKWLSDAFGKLKGVKSES